MLCTWPVEFGTSSCPSSVGVLAAPYAHDCPQAPCADSSHQLHPHLVQTGVNFCMLGGRWSNRVVEACSVRASTSAVVNWTGSVVAVGHPASYGLASLQGLQLRVYLDTPYASGRTLTRSTVLQRAVPPTSPFPLRLQLVSANALQWPASTFVVSTVLHDTQSGRDVMEVGRVTIIAARIANAVWKGQSTPVSTPQCTCCFMRYQWFLSFS
jgi:hypothetical protein